MKVSLNIFYQSVGISKQAVHQHIDRYMRQKSMEHQIVYLVSNVREDHPGMGLRDIYFKLQPEGIGRDRFEVLCKQEGFCVSRPRNRQRTTNSNGVIRFPNLLLDLEVVRTNQVWQSDITYYEVNGRFYYITLIQDTFNKIIVGHSVSSSLRTEQTTLPAMKMAIKLCNGQSLDGLIIHSDGGGQYYDKAFLALTHDHEMQNSMCEYAWDNGMVERLNGVVKNNYLKYRNIKSFGQLQKEVDRTVQLYNYDKPHSSLNRLTPIEFEKKTLNFLYQTRAKMTESFDAIDQISGTSSPVNLNQTKAQTQE